MRDFSKFSTKVEAKFKNMSKNKLIYKVDVDSDLLYQTYLNAFPEGTNPIFRERREHDCSCCRHFIKNIGKIVSIENNKITTVWDIECDEYPYDVVAKAMNEFVSKQRIGSVYFTKFNQYGNAFTLELLENKTTRKWNHFVGHVSTKHHCNDPYAKISQHHSDFNVLKRSLEELSLQALDTVLDLIADGNIYRGEEYTHLIKEFKEKKLEYDAFKSNDKDLYIWQNIGKGAVCRFRNTVIGTLISDLSGGMELEKAVKLFESKVAPANYKRPKALITPKMIEDAMKTIRSLGLESALERRFATFSDISVNNVLFVNNSVKKLMLGNGLEDELLKTVKPKPVKVKNSISITIDDFVNSVLPKANEIQALIKNKHGNNFVSLTAPVHPEVGQLFKWDNNFAWSYDGNIADSDIKSKVKKAGGNINALLRCSLAWFNTDDLDIHVKLPNGNHVSYANKQGILDVDMNAGSGTTRTPVENICFNENNLLNGKYVVSVNNYAKRESIDVGFVLETEYNGSINTYTYPKTVGNRDTVQCLEFIVENKELKSINVMNDNIKGEGISQAKWGVDTETFVNVDSIILSPNYWNENAVGNKHWFFILQDCKNPDSTRGIYNEFLKPELNKHRKVFEIIGEKTKCPLSDNQLSGVGFSSTKKDVLTVKVKSDKMHQLYDIQF